jgi:hypothetical protein
MPDRSTNDSRVSLTLRSALVLLLGLIAGAAAGALTYAARHSLAEAVLASLGAAGAAVLFFDRLIAPPTDDEGA